MKKNLFAYLAGSLSLSFASVSLPANDWNIPDPFTTDHPGAEEAPASSPETFPDEEGFQERGRIILEGVARQDLQAYRRGYFTGGDPGKYLPGHAMAKLLMGVEDSDIERLMNDNRSYREHYHFASMNWGRFLPLFGEAILTEETKEKLAERAFRYTAYLQGGGTENHVTQWRTSAPVLPHYLPGDRGLSHQSKEATLDQGKEWLRGYVKGLYAAGQGEWDSSTYKIYTFNGLLNIYDFAKDEETRLLARAGLEFLATQYALKYRDGVFTAPNQRGFPYASHASDTDEVGYLWYGSSKEVTSDMTRGWRNTNHAFTSSWRPTEVLFNIATKNLPDLPVTFQNSKPNYWGTTGEPRPSVRHETLFLSQYYSLGSLWNGHGSQHTRMQLVAEGDDGAFVFSGGHPRASNHEGRIEGIRYRDGAGRYEQMGQVDGTLVLFARSPEKEENPHVFFTLAEGTEVNEVEEGWHFIEAGNTFLALYPLGEEVRQEEITVRRRVERDVLLIDGANAGWVLETSDRARHDDLASFKTDVLENFELNVEDAETGVIRLRNLQGRVMEYAFNPRDDDYQHANNTANVSIDGEKITFGDWPVYNGPFVHQADGVLRVNDGRRGYEIDFSGDLPVFRDYTP
ncbi:MAG: hypothetical protein LAT55_06880 [Opitutales bacterium]|nr:hypothetical protein [Opitutales bacterium]